MTLSLLCQTIPHFHTFGKCTTKLSMTEGSGVGKSVAFVRPSHTSTHLRSVELGMRKEKTVISHFNTSEKCRTKDSVSGRCDFPSDAGTFIVAKKAH